ncbi:hypothetical protein HD806DRAFT_509154 [Xylariaceae sp. AK1471]|nr:hypothetical protein HD806DRAFT_509154 [Xylariaceae sp. AK1471]
MLGYQGLLLILGSPLVLGGVLGERAKDSPSGQFGLYAYGGSISGASLFYSNDVAFVGDQTQMDDQDAARVVFTTGPNNALLGNPDLTSSRGSPAWANKAFFVPSWTSSSHHVGFTSTDSEPETSTSGFIFYGATALHQGPGNTLQGLWYAVPTRFQKIWALQWNATDDNSDGKMSVTLRSTPPAQPF